MDDARWSAALAHRERLLRIARARLPRTEDAEDVVQEALLRCVEHEGLDLERIGPFLTSVTVRLCADVHRRSEEPARAKRWLAPLLQDEADPADLVCRDAEAALVASLVSELPDRQRRVLVDRAEGMSIPQISARHKLTYKAAESALSRARSAMRAAVAATLGLLGLAVRQRRTAAVALVPAATALTVAGLVLVAPQGPGHEAVPPGGPESLVVAPYAPRTGTVAQVSSGAAGQERGAVRPDRDRSRGDGGPPIFGKPGDPVWVKGDNDDYTPVERVSHCVEHGAKVDVQPYSLQSGDVPDVVFKCHYPPPY